MSEAPPSTTIAVLFETVRILEVALSGGATKGPAVVVVVVVVVVDVVVVVIIVVVGVVVSSMDGTTFFGCWHCWQL